MRILLVSAHPFHRLGREWTDRLISVVQREISYLLPAKAEELIRRPAQDFPDIYPPGGVERIVHETRGHPYLIQFVCDALVRDAAVERQRQATDADLTRAFDRTLRDTVLFHELWSDRTDDERTLLRQMVKEQDAPIPEGTALRELVQQGYVESRRPIRHRRAALPYVDPRQHLSGTPEYPMSTDRNHLRHLLEQISRTHFPNPPASPEDLARFEARVGWRLDEDLRAFYLQCDGANLFEQPDAPYRLLPLAQVTRARVAIHGQDSDEWGPASFYSICAVGDSDYVAVDVATVENGHYPLYDCWHEAFNRPEFRDRIAGSFAEFLDRALASGGRCYWLAGR